MIDMTNPLIVPSTEGRAVSFVEIFVDDVLRTFIQRAPATLVAQHQPGSEAIAWIVQAMGSQPEVIAHSAPVMFRPCLAYLGHQYLGDQIFAGYARRLLVCDKRSVACAIFLSNEQLSGFWIRAYAGTDPVLVA